MDEPKLSSQPSDVHSIQLDRQLGALPRSTLEQT